MTADRSKPVSPRSDDGSTGLPRSIGLIAGNGLFPTMFAQGARKAGMTVAAVAIQGETNDDLKNEVGMLEWLHLGQLGKAIEFFKKHGVNEAAFVGGVGKLKGFRHARPDWLMLKTLSGLRNFNDDGLLRAVAATFEREGIRIIPSTQFLEEVLVSEGTLTKRAPNEVEERDIALGFQIGEMIGRADIGQTIVVFRGNVIAVEAAEGTDSCIQRAGALAGAGIVVVKSCKPGQDRRFDLPTIGPRTVETLIRAGGAVLAVEAKNTVLLEAEKVAKIADDAGLAIVARAAPKKF